MVPESMINTLLSEIHGDMLYGHEGQTNTKERIQQSY
jgi:flagellar biosynthesis/type III secretory pathway chaperone